MGRINVLLIVLSISVNCFAFETGKVDSLKNLLTKDISKKKQIEILLKIAEFELPVKGIKFAKQAYQIAHKHNLKAQKAYALECISICEQKLGNFPNAIKVSIEALSIYDELNLIREKAVLLSQIGTHFANDKNFPEAVNYLEKALTIFRDKNIKTDIAFTLINLGETYRLMNNFTQSEKCFTECLELNKYLRKNIFKGYAMGNLGLINSAKKKWAIAESNLTEAIHILSDLGDLFSVSIYKVELAKISIEKGYIKQGEEILLQSLKIAEDEKLKEQIKDFSLELAKFYEKRNRFKESLKYRKQYEIYNDSLVNIDNVRQIEKLRSRYIIEKKEKDIEILEVRNEAQYRLVIVLFFGAVLLSILSILLYRIKKQREKAYKKVYEQKGVIEIREKEKAVLLRELNHRVKNNLQMVASLFNLQANQFKDDSSASVLKAASLRIDTLILIHQKLYQEDVDGYVKLDDYIRELIDNLIFSFNKKVNLQLNLIPLHLHIDCSIALGIVINELITNSLKYATTSNNEMKLEVVLSKTDDFIQLSIHDDGPGFYSDINKSSSFGLKLVNSMIKQLKGTLQQSNKNGCCWIITLNNIKFKFSEKDNNAIERIKENISL